ncbi:MAG: hypothetical protein K8S16_06160 [Bacteroidales bacterium]|nr:hypothetical protein [Bacteroidales bacterium]
MASDFHASPFSEETRTKLLIFQDYLQKWLPVFLAKKKVIWKKVNIIDFFAGPGCDVNGYEGSPYIIIKEMEPYLQSYYLAPFSIKKGSNIYRLIFGSHHILGLKKILTTAWKVDPERGEANFDIDEEALVENQYDLFTGETEKPKKVEIFEHELINSIKAKNLISNKDVYIYTITRGFLLKHSRKVLSHLLKEGVLLNKKVNLSYDVYNDPTKVISLQIA